VKRNFLTYPADWLKTPRTMHDAARSGCAVEQFHKEQNRALEIAAAVSVAIGLIAAVALHFWS